MAGIEAITNDILQEARDKASKMIEEAKAAAAKVEEEARSAGEQVTAQAQQKAKQEAEAYARRIESQIAMRRKQAVLKEKQDVIADVIAQAKDAMGQLSDDAYFETVLALVAEHAHAQDGEAAFSAADLKRMPKDFAAKLQEAAKKAGGTLTLSDEPAQIEDGFILRYGGIEENCSVRALFEEKKEQLQDLVHGILF